MELTNALTIPLKPPSEAPAQIQTEPVCEQNPPNAARIMALMCPLNKEEQELQTELRYSEVEGLKVFFERRPLNHILPQIASNVHYISGRRTSAEIYRLEEQL